MALIRLLLVAALVYLAIRALRQMLASRTARPVVQNTTKKSPWETLQLDPGATQEEIRSAYQRLVQQYHPDRVSGLAPELQVLAEERTKELNEAYAALRRR